MAEPTPFEPSVSALSRGFRAVDRLLGMVDAVLITASCLALAAIMLLIFADALMRYSFNHPLPFTFDLVTLYLMSTALISAFSYTLRHGGHVSVDLFVSFLPPRLYQTIIGLALVGATLMVGVMAQQVTKLAYGSWVRNEMLVGIYAWPLWLSKACAAVGLWVLALRLLQVGLSNLVGVLTGRDDIVISVKPPRNEAAEDAV